MLLFLIFLLTLNSVASLSNELPDLIKRTFVGSAASVVNVTVGEQFSLPLPQFDSEWNSHTFKTYQIDEQEFQQQSQHSQQKKGRSNSSKQNMKAVAMDYLPFKCSLVEGSISIAQEIKSLPQEYRRTGSTRWQQNSYILLHSKSLLYILNVALSEITAYIYNDHSLEKITTYKINQFIQRQQKLGETGISPPVMALDGQQKTLYLFTSIGIWSVDTKTILSNVKRTQGISGFDSAKVGGLDKVLHGQAGVFVGLRKMDKVFIIPQPSTDPQIQYPHTEITHFNQEKLIPQDIAILGNTVFVLDFNKGIFIYQLLNHSQLVPRFSILLNSMAGNHQFTIYHHSIFVNFNDLDGSKVVQIAIDLESSSYNIVRFYKSGQLINLMKVLSVPTRYYLQPRGQGYGQELVSTFLFMLQNGQDIEIYPFNVDPRIIKKAYNAVKLKGNQVKEFFHIVGDRFIIVTNQRIRYLRLRVNQPSVTCLALSDTDNKPQNYFKLSVTANTSTCQHLDHDQPTKEVTNEYCQMTMEYYLHIGDPDASQHRRAMLYGLVILVVVCFVGGLLCLMQWRSSKMQILGRLRGEIMNFRDRHKKIQPFVEQNYEHREVEIEVPKIEVMLQE